MRIIYIMNNCSLIGLNSYDDNVADQAFINGKSLGKAFNDPKSGYPCNSGDFVTLADCFSVLPVDISHSLSSKGLSQ